MTYSRQLEKTILLGCISENTNVLVDTDCSIRVYQSFVKNISYYAGIMLNAFSDLLCSKLCWHNRLVPTPGHGNHSCTCNYNTIASYSM